MKIDPIIVLATIGVLGALAAIAWVMNEVLP